MSFCPPSCGDSLILTYKKIKCNKNFKKIFKSGIEYVNCPEEALKNAEVVFIFTEWKEIKNLDLKLYENLMKTPIIFDGRNCYDIDLVEEYNIDYYSIGRSEILNINKEI